MIKAGGINDLDDYADMLKGLPKVVRKQLNLKTVKKEEKKTPLNLKQSSQRRSKKKDVDDVSFARYEKHLMQGLIHLIKKKEAELTVPMIIIGSIGLLWIAHWLSLVICVGINRNQIQQIQLMMKMHLMRLEEMSYVAC